MEPVTKTHSIKRTTEVVINPEQSFVDEVKIINNRQLKVKMKSTPGAYYVLEIKPKQAREIIKIAKSGGSIGTYWNSELRNLPYEKVEG